MKNDIRLFKNDFNDHHARVELICNGKDVTIWWYYISDLEDERCHFEIDGVSFSYRDFTKTMLECVEFARNAVEKHKDNLRSSLEVKAKSIEPEEREGWL